MNTFELIKKLVLLSFPWLIFGILYGWHTKRITRFENLKVVLIILLSARLLPIIFYIIRKSIDYEWWMYEISIPYIYLFNLRYDRWVLVRNIRLVYLF